jgi:hypothetical protein
MNVVIDRNRHAPQEKLIDYQASFQLLDGDMSGMPCGPKAAFATRGYFAGQYHRRGRQLGRVLAPTYQEVVVDQLFAGNVQLRTALQPLVEAAETALQLDEAKRSRTIIRVDAGAGTIDDLNWLLARHYEIMAKDSAGKRIVRLSDTVIEWVQDPVWSERSFGWVSEPASESIRSVRRIAVRCRRQDGTFAYGVLICSLSSEQVLTLLGRPLEQAADPVAVLDAYVTFYDLRGGGIETSLKDDKQGLGLTKRNKSALRLSRWCCCWAPSPITSWSGHADGWPVLRSNAMVACAWCAMSFLSAACSALIPACISSRFFSIEMPALLVYSSDPCGSCSLPFTLSLLWAKLR